MTKITSTLAAIAAAFLAWPVAAQQPAVFAAGFTAPAKLSLTPSGKLLVSEATPALNTGRITMVDRGGGNRVVLMDGLPSAAGEGAAIGVTGMILRGNTMWILIGQGDVVVEGPRPGTEVPNPNGPSSPIFSSLLSVRFASSPETLTTGFTLKPADHFTLAYGVDVDLDNGAGAKATVSLVTDFRDFIPDPITIVHASDPFGMDFSPSDPNILYVADAGMNSLVRVDVTTGRPRTITHFPPLPSFAQFPPVMDAVPTSVHAYGDQLLVTLLTGYPFTPGQARVMIVNPQTGASGIFIYGLTSAMDLAFRDHPTRPQFFIAEFSANLGAEQAPPGIVLQYDTTEGKPLSSQLITPSSLALDPVTGELFVSELGTGRILKFTVQ